MQNWQWVVKLYKLAYKLAISSQTHTNSQLVKSIDVWKADDEVNIGMYGGSLDARKITLNEDRRVTKAGFWQTMK